jgi:hypothetical protein
LQSMQWPRVWNHFIAACWSGMGPHNSDLFAARKPGCKDKKPL